MGRGYGTLCPIKSSQGVSYGIGPLWLAGQSRDPLTSRLWVKILNPFHKALVSSGFVQRVLQSQALPATSYQCSSGGQVSPIPTKAGHTAPLEGCFLARHAALVDRCVYRSPFTWFVKTYYIIVNLIDCVLCVLSRRRFLRMKFSLFGKKD